MTNPHTTPHRVDLLAPSAEFTADQIDAGAEALRQYEQSGKRLNSWETLPAGTKRKWRDKAKIVLFAASARTGGSSHGR